MKFYLDENLSHRIVVALRSEGLDALGALEAGRANAPDVEQLAFAARQGRCLVSLNRDDFIELGHQAVRNREPHGGIVVVPQKYTGAEIGLIVRALVRLAKRYPGGLGDYDVVYLD